MRINAPENEYMELVENVPSVAPNQCAEWSFQLDRTHTLTQDFFRIDLQLIMLHAQRNHPTLCRTWNGNREHAYRSEMQH
jgi:hypothetical protein